MTVQFPRQEEEERRKLILFFFKFKFNNDPNSKAQPLVALSTTKIDVKNKK